MTAKGKPEVYFWYISTDGYGDSWSQIWGFNITLTMADNGGFGVGGFALISYCTKNMGNCSISYSFRNIINIGSWGLGNLIGSGNNCVLLRTPSGLATNLNASNPGTYTICEAIIFSQR